MMRLIYHSVALLPAVNRTQSELERILEASRRNNAQASITGLLLHDDRGFTQILEGPRLAVSARFLAIARDPRHRAVVLDDCRSVAARLFPSWSMAFHGDRADLQLAILDWTADPTRDDADLARIVADAGLGRQSAA